MFTGIVTDVGKVVAVAERDHVRRLSIESAYDPDTISVGASIACAGICLTVVAFARGTNNVSVFDVDVAPETLRVTAARDWQAGTLINLERSLRVGDELGGHLVSGHVDGLATVVAREEVGAATQFAFAVPGHLARFIAPKGSVALDGTSLTVNGVSGDRFDCLLIPHTLEVTTWSSRQAGDRVHLEVDQVARYVARLAEAAAADGQQDD
jgi:riboflavin synthase